RRAAARSCAGCSATSPRTGPSATRPRSPTRRWSRSSATGPSRRARTRASARGGLFAAVVCAAALGLTASAATAGPHWHGVVVTKTAGFRHGPIPAAIAAVRRLGAANGFGVDQTEDAGAFTDANLARYRAVIFLLTTGDVLDASQQAAYQHYIE